MNLGEWLDYQQRQHPREIALGLDRVRAVAQRLKTVAIDPLRPAPHVISVAGTNGKGSTVAFIEAIARAAGWRVGAYTSPHLLHYNERVHVDGRDVDDDVLVAAFERIEAARHGDAGDSDDGRIIPLTYFEFGTLAALLVFAESALDLAILEVGLGGRLDAVNIVDANVAVITTVDIDHADWLGDGRETIGMEKAGILRSGRPAILAEADPPASVLRHAYQIGAIAIRAGCDYFVEPTEVAADAGVSADPGWQWREPGYAIALPMPSLRAPSQLDNAGAAIAALRALQPADARFELPDAAIVDGVRNASLPARLQSIDLPCSDGAADILIDVGHNPQAARELAAWLAAHPAAGATDALFSGLADKDLAAVVEPLLPHIRHWLLCGLVAETPRGLTAETVLERVAAVLGAASIQLHADLPAALRAARSSLHAGDRLLVFGSFYTAAAALRTLEIVGTDRA